MIIYKATNLINGKVYIGLTTRTLEIRKSHHLCDAFHKNSNYVFHCALRKYGDNNFSWEVIDNANSKDELITKEIYWINFYNSCIFCDNSHGYNMTTGGGNISDELIRKISEQRKSSGLSKGSKNPSSKLTEENVLEIKELIKSGIGITEIAKKFNMGITAISDIKSGRKWSHVGEDVSFVKYPKTKASKLTENDVLEIKRLIKSGLSFTDIAKKFNSTWRIIHRIKTGETWSHIGEDLSHISYQSLTESDVREIKLLLNEGKLMVKEIAFEFNVSPANITAIKTGKNWKNIQVD